MSSSSSSVLHGHALQHTKVRCVTRSVQRQSVQSTQSRSSALGRAVPTSMKPQVGQHSNYSGMLIHPQSRCFRTLLLHATGATEQSLQETILCARRMLESWLPAGPAMLSLACWVARKAACCFEGVTKGRTIMSMPMAMMLIILIWR